MRSGNLVSKLAKLVLLQGRRISELKEKYTWLRDRWEAERGAESGDPPCIICGKWTSGLLCEECRRKYADLLKLAGAEV